MIEEADTGRGSHRVRRVEVHVPVRLRHPGGQVQPVGTEASRAVEAERDRKLEQLKEEFLLMVDPSLFDPASRDLLPGKQGEIIWQFTKAGEFNFGCLVPGHFEAGMIGKVIVAAFTDSYNNIVRAVRNYKAQAVKGGLGTGGRLGVDGNTTGAPTQATPAAPAAKVVALTNGNWNNGSGTNYHNGTVTLDGTNTWVLRAPGDDELVKTQSVSVAEVLSDEIRRRTGEETVVSDLTYDLRSGEPDFLAASPGNAGFGHLPVEDELLHDGHAAAAVLFGDADPEQVQVDAAERRVAVRVALEREIGRAGDDRRRRVPSWRAQP